MAGNLYEGIRQLNRKEIYSWSKARELEDPSGNASDLEEIAANYAFTHFAFADEVWEEIESMAMTDRRELAHYERLRGQQMRLSPEVKTARKRARAQERQRRKEAEEEQWFQWLSERATELRVELQEVKRERAESHHIQKV